MSATEEQNIMNESNLNEDIPENIITKEVEQMDELKKD